MVFGRQTADSLKARLACVCAGVLFDAALQPDFEPCLQLSKGDGVIGQRFCLPVLPDAIFFHLHELVQRADECSVQSAHSCGHQAAAESAAACFREV